MNDLTPQLKAALQAILIKLVRSSIYEAADNSNQLFPVPYYSVNDALTALQPEIERLVVEAEGKARFEVTYRLLLGAGGELFIPKSMLEVPLTDYEITTYSSPVKNMPGVVYKLTQSN